METTATAEVDSQLKISGTSKMKKNRDSKLLLEEE
jgi:hypothetical protein